MVFNCPRCDIPMLFIEYHGSTEVWKCPGCKMTATLEEELGL